MMIKMTRDQRNVDVAAFANRFAVVQCFEHCEPARMFLYLAGQCIKISSTRMWNERLPRRQSSTRGFHRAINIRGRTSCHRRKFFTSGRLCGVEISAFTGRLPCAVDEMSEAAVMPVQPRNSFAWVLWRTTIPHGHEFFGDSHLLFLNLSPPNQDSEAHAIGWR